MNLESAELQILEDAALALRSGFSDLPDLCEPTNVSTEQTILNSVAQRLHDNFPYHHPMYLGQMMKPPHRLAHLAYTLAMSLNPNNHALDGGRASSEMEKDSIQQIAAMVGWDNALGHLCGGGTIANLEAMWVAREMTDSPIVAVSDQAHYTHSRSASLLGTECLEVHSDQLGRMNINHLKELLSKHNVGTVIATLGTTGLGAIDPLEQIIELRAKHSFRIHIDAAYGGYFKLISNLSAYAKKQYQLIPQADSFVIDPHKHGLQPYGCGCVLFKDPQAAKVYKHDSPYTYFTSDQLHLGEISFECSRAGAAAVALWATLQRFPLIPNGDFAQRLECSRRAVLQLFEWIEKSPLYSPVVTPELDIVVWSVQAESASAASAKARKFFDAAAAKNLHFALVTLPKQLVEPASQITTWDKDEVTCLRACVMKPEHEEWMPRILQLLGEVSNEVLENN